MEKNIDDIDSCIELKKTAQMQITLACLLMSSNQERGRSKIMN